MTRCRTCDAEIIWAKTPTGKAMPLDAVPAQNGTLVLVDGTASHSPMGSDAQRAETVPLARYTSHFATCPQAAQHRKER